MQNQVGAHARAELVSIECAALDSAKQTENAWPQADRGERQSPIRNCVAEKSLKFAPRRADEQKKVRRATHYSGTT
jgi:hypothetical protein